MWEAEKERELAETVVGLRRQFHSFPEVSGEEYRTSRVITDYLTSLGVEFKTFSEHAGVLAIIKGTRPGPTIALRSDMDALPIEEENDVPYRSQNAGVMHACGHDGHMAILLGVATMLAASKKDIAGTIKLVFQPAEEAAPHGGARFFLRDGVLDDVDSIFGLHLWPDWEQGYAGFRQGPMMAASDRFTIKVLGQGAHASQPHKGTDAITMAAEIIQCINSMMSRQIDPLETATLSIGSIHGGERYNVIAKEVILEGTIRTLSSAVRDDIPRRIEKILAGITSIQGAGYSFEYQRGYPVLNNWTDASRIVMEAAGYVLGPEYVFNNMPPVLGSEDYAGYLEKIPGCFFLLGCAKRNSKQYPLHNSRFDLDETTLVTGVKVMCEVVSRALSAYRQTETAGVCSSD